MSAGDSWPRLRSGATRYHRPMAESVSAALAPIALPDTDGREVRLGSLWAERPAVLVFLRHYG